MTIELHHIDCMEYMSTCEDNAFDLAIVDPPYGIGAFWNKDNKNKAYKSNCHGHADWNTQAPSNDYFLELFRVSKNQIIWGGNYYCHFLPMKNSWTYWKKGISAKTNMSMGELAWTSFNRSMIDYEIMWSGFISQGRAGFHPCEKPVLLYEKTLGDYAIAGQRILDTHLGSGSSAIAAHYYGVDFVGCELDEHYFTEAKARIERETAQVDLFEGVCHQVV